MTTTPTSGAADLPEALRRSAAADGKTELFNLPGYPLMVRAVDFNRIHAESEMRRAALLDEMQKAALAAGQATAAQAVVPAGWKLVPVDATDEMVRATDEVNFENGDTDGTLHNVWHVMIAAAPAQPSPTEGMAGRVQVYRCKIKSKKQIDKEIPREQQGWWADVAAGQKLLLRQAVQSDLDRCTLGGKRSRNPADYMCETENHGSLVSKVALEYMNPEQNVFAAAPGPADGESNV